jgi:hypothetical protein
MLQGVDERNDPGPRVLPAILRALNEEVLTELRLAASIEHPGESGRAREQIITRFLRRLLPSGYAVSTGFVIDAVGGISRQVDLVIHRTGYHPVLEIGGVDHFLVESVVAIIENKAAIDSVANLQTALENIGSVKRLDRSNGGKNTVFHLSGKVEKLHQDAFEHQVFGGIVTEASLTIDNFRSSMLDYMLEHPRSQWPNHYVDVHRFAAGYWGAHSHDPGGPEHTTFGAVPRISSLSTKPRQATTPWRHWHSSSATTCASLRLSTTAPSITLRRRSAAVSSGGESIVRTPLTSTIPTGPTPNRAATHGALRAAFDEDCSSLGSGAGVRRHRVG